MSFNNNSKALTLVLFITGACLIFIFSMTLGEALYAEISSQDLPKEQDVEKARKIIINVKTLDQMEKLPGNLAALPAVPIPANNPQTDAKIELGKMLFFDKRLSGDKLTSCATCHDPMKGFADGKARATGVGGKELGRHSPTVMNAAYNGAQFWDGRVSTMEEQAEKPIEAQVEMNLPREELAKRLNKVPEYKKRFRAVFGEDADLTNVGKAIAAFERTIVTPDSPFDQYERGNKQALSEQEKKGLTLFVSKAACSQCHNGPNFTDSKFHVLGIPQKGPLAEDLGRYAVTKDESDKGAFKTPSLRNVALTAPYMHDGAFEKLEEVVDFYNQGGGTVSNKSPKIMKLHLTNQEKKDLVAFLNALTGKLPVVSIPQLPKGN